MLRKIGFGLLWFVVFYFVSAMIIGGIAGMQAGANAPDARSAGAAAGGALVMKLAPFLLLASALLAGLGAWKGFLPGTRPGKKDEGKGGL